VLDDIRYYLKDFRDNPWDYIWDYIVFIFGLIIVLVVGVFALAVVRQLVIIMLKDLLSQAAPPCGVHE